MKSMLPDGKRRFFIVMVCGICITVLILLIMNKDYPLVGHDYRYFIPHLIDTELHIQLHGLSIQWYTPSFGGGLPAFPNPQHIEYSLVQLLSMVLSPWSAILLSTAGVSLLGYYYFYRFLNEIMELNWMASILGGMFWIGNGFYIEHLISGILGYQLFPLGAVILFAIFDHRNPYLLNAILIAVMTAMMVHQAGFYLIIILLLSFGITLPVLLLYAPSSINSRRLLLTGLAACILSGAMTASKIYATYAFMRFFPRIISDTFTVGYFQGMIGIVAQLFGVMSFEPFLIITHQNSEFLSGALSNITGSEYGIWETDIALSPVLIFLLFMGVARAVSQIRRFRIASLDRSTLVRFLLLFLAVWITLEMTLAKGIIYTITKQLPVLKSLHVNTRFAAALILPLSILGAIELDRYFLKNPMPVRFWAIAILTSLSLLSYFSLSKGVYESDFNVSASNSLHEKIQHGMNFPVTDITDADLDYWRGFSERSSLYRPYEPVFGYELESFSSETHPGKILEASNGYFNMTSPASLVFPEINDLHPFERFRLGEQETLEIFLERGQPAWEIPPVQKFLNWVSVLTAFLSSGVLLTVSMVRNIRTGRIKPFNS